MTGAGWGGGPRGAAMPPPARLPAAGAMPAPAPTVAPMPMPMPMPMPAPLASPRSPAAWMAEAEPELDDIGAPGWTPPPAPGLVPLRPMTFGEVLGATFRLFRTNASATLGSAFVVLAVTSLLAIVLPALSLIVGASREAAAVGDDVEVIEAGNVGTTILATILAAAIAGLGSAVMQAILCRAVADGALGERATVGSLWARASRRTLPIAGLALLMTLAMAIVAVALLALILIPAGLGSRGWLFGGVAVAMLLALAFIAVYVVLGVRLSLAPSAIVLEGAGLAEGLRRSWRLTRGAFWRSFGVLAVVQLAAQTATSSVSGALQLIAMLALGLGMPLGEGASGQEGLITGMIIVLLGAIFVMSSLVSAMALVLTGGAPAILYLDLRMRAEGLNVALARRVERRAAGLAQLGDPYAPPTRDAGPEAARRDPAPAASGAVGAAR